MIQLIAPLHHAYGVPGSAGTLTPQILKALEKSVGFVAKGNPDFRAERHEVLGIDEARALKEAAERTAVTGGKKVFIVSAHRITREAQNALLKILEEPPSETHFFLIVPSCEMFLPTLRSRLLILRASDSRNQNQMLAERVTRFLQDAVPARLKTVQVLLKQREETESSGEITAFFDELEYALAAQERKQSTPALSELLRAKAYSRDRAPSFKLLLEHLALVLPKVK